MRIRKILISCVVFGLCTALAGLWIVGVLSHKQSEREKSDEEARVAQLSQHMDNCERQIALYREMDVRTNTMFKIMIPAGVATNIVTRRIAQRLREQREGLSPWR